MSQLCRCYERLKAKSEGATRLAYTGFRGGLEHLKIETRSTTHGRWRLQGFLPQLDEFYFTTTEKENFEQFREIVYEAVRQIHITRFPYNKFLYPDFKDALDDKE